jgi:serine/threonine protein kinase
MPDLSGKTLGKVNIEGLIARGGMAEVYLGEHSTLRRKVAVKVMRSQVDQDPEIVARFQREAHVVAGLRHPNIVQMYDYELVDGQPCLVMEYISGPSLSAYLKAIHKRGEKLPLSVVAHILHSLANALDYAHNQHIVHRDIKPANVMLRSPGGTVDIDRPLPADVEPILTDFGLVRLLDSTVQTSTGTVSGTPTYMSPEQARGDKIGPHTDIYSLGVMLYEMLAGVVPFEADSTFGVLMKHLNDPPPPIFGISTDLQAVIDRALAKDVQFRYASAGEFANEFMDVFNGQTVSTGTYKLAQLARKSVQGMNRGGNSPFQWNWIVGGALALIAIAFVAFRYNPGILSGKISPDAPVGHATYSDFNFIMDKASINITDLPAPGSGTHYEGWYLSGGGETRQNVGNFLMGADGQGQLTFTDPEQRNIIEVFDQFEVTIEPNNDPNPDQSSGEVAASFIYPPLALVHVRHLLSRFDGAPDGTALIQGLWYAADGIDTSAFELQQAYTSKDEALVHQKAEEIINQLVGDSNSIQYIDWDNDGVIADPGDGFGLIAGYIPGIISHTNFATQSIDASENVHLQSRPVLVCLENMEGWSKLLLEQALRLVDTPFGSEMEPQITEIVALAGKILIGIDSNGNGLIEPIVGEGGASTAYEYAYYLADMDLLPGPDRIPPPAPENGK